MGDSCLFVVRNDRLWMSFPMEDAAQFDNNPTLVCSKPDNADRTSGKTYTGPDGECVAGDSFILASDALACWFLGRKCRGREALEKRSSRWTRQDGLRGWRSSVTAGLMRNDDTTLTIIRVA